MLDQNEKNFHLLSGGHDAIGNSGGLLPLFLRFGQFLKTNFSCCLPVKVVEFNRSTHKIKVQPLPKALSARTGESVVRQPFLCTALLPKANGFLIDFPIRAGDTGWIIASDVATLNVKNTRDVVIPEATLTHSYSNGFFVPDWWGVVDDGKRGEESEVFHGEDDRLVISSFDGRQKLSIGRAALPGEESSSEGDILITSKKDDGNFTTILVKNGEITVNSTTKVSVSSPVVHIDGGEGEAPSAVDITGTLTVSGDIKTTGGDVTQKDGVVLGTHTHEYYPGSGAATETDKPTTA